MSRNKLISFDLQKEILDDFVNIQKRNILPGFSEFSSTLHFTALNSRDIINSKRNNMNNHLHLSKSISLVNVLDELNNNNNVKNHIMIQDNNAFNSKINISITDNTRLVKQWSTTTNNNIIHINSYVIANRTHSNQIGKNDLTSKDNNDAIIHSDLINSNVVNNELVHENIFYNVDKLVMTANYKKMPSQGNIKNNILNDIVLTFDGNKFNHLIRKYLEDIDEYKVDWRSFTKPRFCNDRNIQNINQGIVHNCSVIASIISIVNYDKKFSRNTYNSIFFPQKNGIPCISKDGYYNIKIYFNGMERYIEIDDLMPYNRLTGAALFANTPDDISVNLIEKAIFILYGSQHFTINTNPAYEIYHLTGWIPEICLFENIENKSYLWNRLYVNFNEGNIILCLGTNSFADKSKLQTEHSYSVLEFVETGEEKIIKLKNPWGDKSQSDESGSLWLEWEYIYQNFSYIFISWNPDTYSYKYSFSSSWKNFNSQSKFYNEDYSLEYNPQYLITIPEHKDDFEMRLLLTRSINSLNNKQRKTISYKLYYYEGYPLIYSTDCLRSMNNHYREVNSDVFIFAASNEIDQYVLVINKSELDEEETNFFLDIFSFINISIEEIPRREFIDTKRFIDSWNSSKLSGNLLSPNVIYNPQYRLNVKNRTHFQIRLETVITTPIMIIIVDGGKHLTKVDYDAYINNKNPGFYFNSFSYFECVINPGEYTIICVSQEDKLIGKYCLEVSVLNKSEFIVEKISQPGYTYTEIMRAEWMQKNSIPEQYIKTNINLFLKNPGFIFNTQHSKTSLAFGLKISKNKFKNYEAYNLGIYIINLKNDILAIIYEYKATALANIGIYTE